MKILVGLLLFANLAAGFWNYTHALARHPLPRPIHPERLQVVSGSAGPMAGTALKAAPVPVPAPSRPPVARPKALPPPPASRQPPQVVSPLKKTAYTPTSHVAPAARTRQCWELGPVKRRKSAMALLHRTGVAGRVVSRLGRPAYRVYLPAGPAWPPAGALRRLGVVGAYVTHGPAGGEVLSLGVFLRKRAALLQLRALRAHHVAALMGPFGAPQRYYAQIRLSAAPRSLLNKLKGVGHRRCGVGR
jgi:hypothetical protein